MCPAHCANNVVSRSPAGPWRDDRRLLRREQGRPGRRSRGSVELPLRRTEREYARWQRLRCHSRASVTGGAHVARSTQHRHDNAVVRPPKRACEPSLAQDVQQADSRPNDGSWPLRRTERALANAAVRTADVRAIGASRVRHDASAYVLDVANTFHPELADPRRAARPNRIDHLERTTS